MTCLRNRSDTAITTPMPLFAVAFITLRKKFLADDSDIVWRRNAHANFTLYPGFKESDLNFTANHQGLTEIAS